MGWAANTANEPLGTSSAVSRKPFGQMQMWYQPRASTKVTCIHCIRGMASAGCACVSQSFSGMVLHAGSSANGVPASGNAFFVSRPGGRGGDSRLSVSSSAGEYIKPDEESQSSELKSKPYAVGESSPIKNLSCTNSVSWRWCTKCGTQHVCHLEKCKLIARQWFTLGKTIITHHLGMYEGRGANAPTPINYYSGSGQAGPLFSLSGIRPGCLGDGLQLHTDQV
jgi:hypothetical protein